MNSPTRSSRFLMLITLSMLVTAAAQAQATRTWVSGVGDDANPCSRTAPCKTFAGAISKTAVHGEINCLDPGGFGAVTITKSITIDCSVPNGSILNASSNGVVVNFDSFGADVRKTVRLRNLTFQGANTGLRGVYILGSASAGSEVYIENCLIDGNYGSPGRGVEDARMGGGELTISNSTIRNNLAHGIFVSPAGGSTRIDVALDGVHVDNNDYGLFVGHGVRLVAKDCYFSHQSSAGAYILSSPTPSEVLFDSCLFASNGTGIQHVSGSMVRLSNNDIFGNNTAIMGTTTSFGTNRLVGNTNAGTAPTTVGVASSANGQQ